MKQRIRLSETKLRGIIKESVMRILKENDEWYHIQGLAEDMEYLSHENMGVAMAVTAAFRQYGKDGDESHLKELAEYFTKHFPEESFDDILQAVYEFEENDFMGSAGIR